MLKKYPVIVDLEEDESPILKGAWLDLDKTSSAYECVFTTSRSSYRHDPELGTLGGMKLLSCPSLVVVIEGVFFHLPWTMERWERSLDKPAN